MMSPQSNEIPSPLNSVRVSVIIPIYNGEDDLPGLLDCLFRQTYPAAEADYWLVDNGSRDRTADLIKAAIPQAEAQGITLHYLSETQIQSSYAARNRGIRAAQGEILAFTDADCYPEPNWLADLVAPFADPAIGLVVGEIKALMGKSLLERYAERQNTLSQTHTLAHPFCPYGQTANLAVRAQAFKQVGLFRPQMTTGGDADLCWRVQQEGHWALAFAETAVIRHRHRSTLKDLRSQWYRYGRSNRYLHELYGVDLTRELTPKEVRYRLARWLLKELPLTAVNAIAGRAALVDFVTTPIDLYCFGARTAGQQESKLPTTAQEKEWL